MTERCAVIGQDIEYGRIEAPLDGFERTVDAFRAAGGRGLNITLPFKQAAFRYCAELSERAQRAQAVNTLAFRERVFGDSRSRAGRYSRWARAVPRKARWARWSTRASRGR